MRNRVVGFRVLDEGDHLLTSWGRLMLTDLIPGDDCWGKLVFTTTQPAKVVRPGVPHIIQVAVNSAIPSQTYDIPMDNTRYHGSVKEVAVGGEVAIDRVVIEVEGDGVLLEEETDGTEEVEDGNVS